MKVLRWLLLLGFGTLLLYGGAHLPRRGEIQTPSAERVSPRYIAGSLSETDTPNIVTAIIVDYRSFDTLGETLVIFTAGLACFFIMGPPVRRR